MDLTVMWLSAGHDDSVLSQRARRIVELEVSICPGCNLHLHRVNSDCSQPICSVATFVWPPHDGAVSRP